MMLSKLIKLMSNKVLLYLTSRYLTYTIQFFSLIILSAKLEPYYFGIWGFILMLLGYFSIINFGITNSLNVFIIQSKSNLYQVKNYVASALVAIGGLIVGVFIIACLYGLFRGSIFDKYHLGNLFYIVCLIAVFQYVNHLFSDIYRAKNRLFELSFYQSIIPLLVFLVVVCIKDKYLFFYLLGAYVVGHLLSFSLFLFRGGIPWGGKPSKLGVFNIIKKGFFLFLYNSCFYLILTTTSSMVSYYYTVEEYGLYAFSYSFGHAVLMILAAFTLIIFPKIIDKFYSGDNNVVNKVLTAIRINYVTLSHGLMYIALLFFPLLTYLLPKFQNALVALNLTALALLLSTNSFGYNTLLIARNKEKKLALVSIISLTVNIVVGLLVAVVLDAPFYYVVFCVMVSYFVFAFLCTYLAKKQLQETCNVSIVLLNMFPLKLLIPYIIAVIIALSEIKVFACFPLVLFIILNFESLKEIRNTVNSIKNRPNIVDINN